MRTNQHIDIGCQIHSLLAVSIRKFYGLECLAIGFIQAVTEDNFERESFGSDRWEKSQRATDENGKTLQKRGQLAASITSRVGNDFARIGSNKKYAAIHHLGGKTKAHKIRPKKKKALAFGGLVLKSVNHPGSDIPARRYLPIAGGNKLQPGAEERLLDIALDALAKGL